MEIRKIFLFTNLVLIAMGLSLIGFILKPFSAKAATHGVALSTDVQSYLAFDVTSGDSVALGNLTPGTPICSSTASVASVTTNAANGYTIGVSDSVAGTNSALLHTDATTRIPDMTNGTVATPVVWGTNIGLGVGLWAADTTKEAAWGAGTTVCDALNKYAAIPQNAATAHTVTGYVAGADTSSWSWKIDVANTQKTGAYSGSATFTATAVLS